MAQPVSGFSYSRITAAGSGVLRNRPALFHTANVEISTGTIVLYDNASGTSSAVVATLGGGAAIANTFVYDVNLTQGLYYVATGTPTATLSIE